MPNQKKKAKLRKEADLLWYRLILKLHPICEICEVKKSFQSHHFFPKSCYSHLRYEILNGCGLCMGCHFRLTHQDKRLEDKIREKRGEKWFKKISRLAKNRPESSYLTIKYYEDIIKKLQ